MVIGDLRTLPGALTARGRALVDEIGSMETSCSCCD
jgi:hypothetical protein